ncbi:MAG: hypothetical protein SVM80_04720 [Halobacteriota archaeon]|nr:hypothetical protein [Halobacteriota archaeon]
MAQENEKEVIKTPRRNVGGGRGMGSGRGRGRMGGTGSGPGGECKCPSCGHTIPHQAGMPCYQQKCPECGSQMIRPWG